MSNDQLHNLMLDALRRGMLMMRGGQLKTGEQNRISSSSCENLTEIKRRLCQRILSGDFAKEQKVQILLAVVHIAGFETIGAQNNGCLVDITNWNDEQVKKLSDVINFASK